MVHSWWAKRAIASHKSLEAAWNEVQKWCQLLASTPEGPAAPKVRRAADQIMGPFKASKIMGWKGADSDTSEIKQSCDSGWAGGCFSFKMSRTRQFGLDGSIWSFSWRRQPCWCPVINLKAALVFPSNIKLAKDLTNWESEMFVEREGKWLWIPQSCLHARVVDVVPAGWSVP